MDYPISYDNTSIKSFICSIFNTLARDIELLLNQGETDRFNPDIEALVIVYSKVHLDYFKEYMFEPGKKRDGFLFPETKMDALKMFSYVVNKNSKLIRDLFSNEKKQLNTTQPKKDEIGSRINQMAEDLIYYTKQLSRSDFKLLLPRYADEKNEYKSFELFVFKLSIIKKSCNLEKGLNSLIAAEFWDKNFPFKNEVPFEEFIIKFQVMSNWMHGEIINDEDLKWIRKHFTRDKVAKQEFDEFIWQVWNLGYKRHGFLGTFRKNLDF